MNCSNVHITKIYIKYNIKYNPIADKKNETSTNRKTLLFSPPKCTWRNKRLYDISDPSAHLSLSCSSRHFLAWFSIQSTIWSQKCLTNTHKWLTFHMALVICGILCGIEYSSNALVAHETGLNHRNHATRNKWVFALPLLASSLHAARVFRAAPKDKYNCACSTLRVECKRHADGPASQGRHTQKICAQCSCVLFCTRSLKILKIQHTTHTSTCCERKPASQRTETWDIWYALDNDIWVRRCKHTLKWSKLSHECNVQAILYVCGFGLSYVNMHPVSVLKYSYLPSQRLNSPRPRTEMHGLSRSCSVAVFYSFRFIYLS